MSKCMIDWSRVLRSTLGYSSVTIVAFFVMPPSVLITFPLLIARFFSDLGGIKIFIADNIISYPRYFWRSKIRIGEIKNINMEYSQDRLFHFLSPKSDSPLPRIYSANLSGDFGQRQIQFYDKSYRDKFLSLMEEYSDAKITRWV